MPAQEKQENETLDFNKPDFSFTPSGVHDWKQQGTYIVCGSCDIEHAVGIGINKILVGIDPDGQPMLVDKTEYFKDRDS